MAHADAEAYSGACSQPASLLHGMTQDRHPLVSTPCLESTSYSALLAEIAADLLVQRAETAIQLPIGCHALRASAAVGTTMIFE